ncbi:MAG: hypothetical protein ACTSU3_07480 [Candidatus Thorarchaeota archaeon]
MSSQSKQPRAIEQLVDSIADLYEKSNSRLVYTETSCELIETFRENLEQVATMLDERLFLDGMKNQFRVAVVEHRIYVWKYDDSSDKLIDGYSEERFYFGNKRKLERFVGRIFGQLDLDETSASMKHLNELILQLRDNDSRTKAIRSTQLSVRGYDLKLCLDVIGFELNDIEGEISKLTGINGQGAIKNPKFPNGAKLSELRVRLGAIINSDCHIRKDGMITYYESSSERIDIVETLVNGFGDITLHRGKRGGRYEVCFPRSIGRAFLIWEFTAGDKPLQNNQLSIHIRNASIADVKVYFEELIPEDGYFTPHAGFSWSRSVVLNPGIKREKYHIAPLVGMEEINLVRDHGDTHWMERQLIGISPTKLREIAESKDERIAAIANSLLMAIYANQSALMNDEIKLLRRLKINAHPYPKDIVYSNRTGRFSVNWTAYVFKNEDKMRWALLCPPNDIIKRKKVAKWVRENQDLSIEVKEQLHRQGHKIG